MTTFNGKWTRSLFTLALLALFVSAGTLLAAKPDRKGKPPKDDPPPPEIDISFSMTLLGTLGGPDSEPWGMNLLGDVVGKSQTADGTWAPFVYFSDTGQMVDLRSLLTPADEGLWHWESFLPVSINSGRQLCGTASKFDEFGVLLQRSVVRITLSGQVAETAMVEIVSPIEAISSGAGGINELGEVAGSWLDSEGIRRTFVYSDDPQRGTTDIGNLGGGRTTAWAINYYGEVTGLSEKADGEPRAYLYAPGAGLQDLGIIRKTRRIYAGGNYSAGYDLNDEGTVVGLAVAGAGAHDQMTVVHAFREAGDGMDDLGTLDGHSDSEADGINSVGEIVGESYGGSPSRGFLYTDEFGPGADGDRASLEGLTGEADVICSQ